MNSFESFLKRRERSGLNEIGLFEFRIWVHVNKPLKAFDIKFRLVFKKKLNNNYWHSSACNLSTIRQKLHIKMDWYLIIYSKQCTAWQMKSCLN